MFSKSLMRILSMLAGLTLIAIIWYACNKQVTGLNTSSVLSGDAATQVYVPPGQMDKFYLFTSGGFSGQIGVYGLPSGRLLREIPVFSVDAEKGYGFNEETKPMLQTTHGFIPWDDAHHPELSQTQGQTDGRWIFINGN